jgi:hypothetical protein
MYCTASVDKTNVFNSAVERAGALKHQPLFPKACTVKNSTVINIIEEKGSNFFSI